MLTTDWFKKTFPTSRERTEKFVSETVDELNELFFCENSEFNTLNRRAAFLAQCAHESCNFSVVSENLNYSAKGLYATFRKYFKSEAAAVPYSRNPSKIANYVYANRNGNGSVESGDGYRYRGRGFIQLTGKANYAAFGASLSGARLDLTVTPELLSTSVYLMVKCAAWFFTSNDLNRYSDNADITTQTKRINGGTNGLSIRKAIFEKLLKEREALL